MKTKEYILLLFILITPWMGAVAQHDIQLSQKGFNRIVYNPAATGQSNSVDMHLLARQQWNGFPDAPSTQVVNVGNYFDKLRFGMALTVINDELGAQQYQNVKLKYAYHAWLSPSSYLSFGAGAGFMAKSFNQGELIYDQDNDPAANINESSIVADFDFGLEYNTRRFTLGVSATHLTNSTDKLDLFQVPRHYYGYASYDINLSHIITFTPMVSVNHVQELWLYEFTGMAGYNNQFWTGMAYRLDEAYVFLAKARLLPWLQLGYSYDMDAGKLRSFSGTSHEIMLIGNINKKDINRKTPRFFD
ncbi:MAG: type IX secretion system membrane protein PorP/SprF [Bacteroidales bacterium]|nr:type IX secretion system membrane protein PorP/SprF [Bacteroidales bacterium]